MQALSLASRILYSAAGMFWLMFWPLVLGFTISGLTQVFVSKERMVKYLGQAGPKELGLAGVLGAASSSCSYAAAAMARALFEKGAHIITAFAFMLASTNLVIELGVVLWQLMGWRFVVAEFAGGILLIALVAVLMRLFGPIRQFERLRQTARHAPVRAESCCHAGHAQREKQEEAPVWARVAEGYLREWRMLWKDIVLGVVLSAALMTLVPHSFWRALLLPEAPIGSGLVTWRSVENALVGPLVAVISFVCSVGNIPVAAALYRHGIGFGSALSFIYADLITVPLILVYRKYYGWKIALWMVGLFYVAMATAGFAIGLLFTWLNLVPVSSFAEAQTEMSFFRLNYTFWLNLAAVLGSAALIWIGRRSLAMNR